MIDNDLISGKEGGQSNYSHAHYVSGHKIVEQVLDQVRLHSELSENLDHIAIFSSLSGATGTGVTDLLISRLSIEKQNIIKYNIFPSPNQSNIITEPYNFVLNLHSQISDGHMSINFDNEQLYKICEKMSITSPDFYDINKLISLQVSNITCKLKL
jgi:hypothetical protein